MDTLVVGQCNGLCCIVDLLPCAVEVLLEMFTFVLSLGKELFTGFFGEEGFGPWLKGRLNQPLLASLNKI